MAGKVGKQCKEYRCPGVVYHDGKYCEKHSNLEEYHRHNVRRQERLAFYRTPEWLSLQAEKLAADPVCQICARQLAVLVHHLKPVRQFPELAREWDNLQSVCSRCHNRESQRESMESRKGKNVHR